MSGKHTSNGESKMPEEAKKPFKSTVETAVGFTELRGHLQRIEDMIRSVKDKQDEMSEDITKIKEAIYNPDQGIYSRLKDVEQKVKDHDKIVILEQQVKDLQEWKAGIVKLAWAAITGILGSIGLAIWNIIKHS